MNSHTEKYKHYLLAFSRRMKEEALAEVECRRRATDKIGVSYHAGRLSAYHRVISLLQQQAEGFDIPVTLLGLQDIDADRDLI